MAAFTRHILICGKSRKSGVTRGSCDPEEREALQSAFQQELQKAGLSWTTRTLQTACLDHCEHGPVLVIDPQAIWSGGIKPQDVARIVDRTIARGEILSDLVIDHECLNNPDCPHRAGS